METPRREAIVRRPDEESVRESFPSGFPNPIDVPAARYVDPEFLNLERERVFARCWLYAAHAGELPNAGDFLRLESLERIGHPLFLVRGADGRIRPDGPSRCSYEAHFFAPVARRAENGGLLDAPIETNWRVLLEYQERRIRYVREELDRRIGPERVAPPLRVPPLRDPFLDKE